MFCLPFLFPTSRQTAFPLFPIPKFLILETAPPKSAKLTEPSFDQPRLRFTTTQFQRQPLTGKTCLLPPHWLEICIATINLCFPQPIAILCNSHFPPLEVYRLCFHQSLICQYSANHSTRLMESTPVFPIHSKNRDSTIACQLKLNQ